MRFHRRSDGSSQDWSRLAARRYIRLGTHSHHAYIGFAAARQPTLNRPESQPKAARPMPVMSDRWIRRMALDHGMIEPFVDDQVRAGVVSFGLSSYGYDIRVADEFKVFTNINNLVIENICIKK